mgnify:CR=1 FL=1
MHRTDRSGRLAGFCGRAVAALACALLPLALQAAEAGLQKVGEARLKVLFWSVYDSRLYAPGGEYDPGTRPLKLEIQYLRDISAEALVRRTGKEWDALGLSHDLREEWLDKLRALWPDISQNDRLAVELDARSHATFFYNGKRLDTIADGDFGQSFVDIWLSPDTSRPDIRLALIGGTKPT